MSESASKQATGRQAAPALWKSILLCLPMLAITFLLLSHGKIPKAGPPLIAFIATYLFLNGMFFLMIHTGKTDKWRAPVFIAYSVFFVLSFISHLIGSRGSMSLSDAVVLEGLTPFCHVVIPMTLIPAALTKTIIFPGTILGGYASIASMFALWIGATIALGRGFCSWFCFFGGMDDGCSRIRKKPFFKNIDPKWKYLPFSVLLIVVIWAALAMSPVYCQWLCPFKTVTEFSEVNSVKTAIQAVIFVSLFLALVVALPILTRRRTQCAFFCPFGAMQSLTNKLNVFEVRVDKEKCVKCGLCARECPTLSIDREEAAQGRSDLSCTKCGKCVDACPRHAPFFHVKGAPLSAGKGETYRRLFLYAAFIFLAVMSSEYFMDGLAKLMRLATTGSLI